LSILKLEKTGANIITTLIRMLYTNASKWFEIFTRGPWDSPLTTVDYTVLDNSNILRTIVVHGAK